MNTKSDLLKELGWTEELIQHYFIDDSDFSDQPTDNLTPSIFDSNTYTVVCRAETSGNQIVVSAHHME